MIPDRLVDGGMREKKLFEGGGEFVKFRYSISEGFYEVVSSSCLRLFFFARLRWGLCKGRRRIVLIELIRDGGMVTEFPQKRGTQFYWGD